MSLFFDIFAATHDDKIKIPSSIGIKDGEFESLVNAALQCKQHFIN